MVESLNRIVPDGMSGVASIRELAEIFTTFSGFREIGAEVIRPRRVERWYRDRRKTGFPECEPERRPTSGSPPVRVWDITKALEWFLTFVPPKGGPPPGNKNGLIHGRYVGERARRAARAAARAAAEQAARLPSA